MGTSNGQYVDDGTYGATFPDFSGTGTTTITTTSSGVSPAAIVISNSTGSYNFAGGMIGGGGTLGLLKQNAGVAMLSAPNGYTGGTSVFGGMLVVNGGDSRLGNASGGIGLDNGATLQIAGSDLLSARNISVYNDGGGTIDTNGFNASTSGVVIVNGPLTKAGSGNLTFSGNNVVFSGTNSTLTINSGGNVIYAGNGTTSFGGGGQFNGNLVVTGLPNLNFDNVVTGGSGQIQIQSAGTVTGTNASTLNQWVLLSNSQTSAGLITSAGTISTNILLNSGSAAFTPINVAAAPFSLKTANNFIVGFGSNAGPTPFVINGSISGNSDVVLGSNTQYGGLGITSGTLMLGGTNTYTGTTLMAGNGVIQMGSSAALPSTTDVVFDATATGATTTLDLHGYSEQINSLSSNTITSKTTISNTGSQATLTISGATVPATYPYGGSIRGNIGISKAGAGLLALSGSNTYTGGTTVSGGTLWFGNAGATGSGLVSVGGAGTALLTGPGVVSLNGAVSLSAGATLLASGFNTGTGTLNIAGGLTLFAERPSISTTASRLRPGT